MSTPKHKPNPSKSLTQSFFYPNINAKIKPSHITIFGGRFGPHQDIKTHTHTCHNSQSGPQVLHHDALDVPNEN